MYEPRFQRTDTLIAMIGRIEAARAIVLRAPIAARWESQLRREALIRSAHHSTSIEGNPLSLEEVTDLLEGREVAAHPREKREVLNYVEVLDYIDREYQSRPDKSVTEDTICQLHRLVVRGVLPEYEAGRYRQVPVLGQVVHRAAGAETSALDLNPRQIRALEFLLHEPRLTTALYSQWNRVSRATAQRDLADLVARGLLEQRGLGRGTYYVLPGSDEAQTVSDEA